MTDPADTPGEVESTEADGATPPDELGDGGKKALDAERKARRDAERRERDLRARVTELETAEVRRDVAAEKGLTDAQAKRLAGATREELEADAEELLEALTPAGGATPPPSTRPVADLRGGLDPTQVEDDPSALADRIVGRGL